MNKQEDELNSITVNSIEELKELMRIPSDALPQDIKGIFEKIAEILINHAYIQRGKERYYINEIEFYYYNKNHRDIITYPRETSALQWYRNAFFGVDLTFESNVETEIIDDDLCYSLEKGNPSYGGILIRKLSHNGTVISGPRLCANKLFDILDATHLPEDYPLLKIDELKDRGCSIDNAARTNIVSKSDEETINKKVKNILWNNWYEEEFSDNLVKDFKTYIDAKYKYFVIQRL
jgi:hypothetical protein